MRSLVLALAVVALSACAIQASVTRASDKQFAPKPDSCNVEFFRTQRPAVAYDEIGAIHLTGSVMETPQDAQESLRRKACELGADAVVVTDEIYQVPNVGLRVTATAVAYRKEVPGPALTGSVTMTPEDAGTP